MKRNDLRQKSVSLKPISFPPHKNHKNHKSDFDANNFFEYQQHFPSQHLQITTRIKKPVLSKKIP